MTSQGILPSRIVGSSIGFQHHGVHFRVDVHPLCPLELASEFLPIGHFRTSTQRADYYFTLDHPAAEDQDTSAGWIVESERGLLCADVRLEDALETLESALNFTVAMASPDKVFVHAGAVAWRNKAIVMPGRSLAGKTSLVCALLAAGATYLSDEFAVVDQCGTIHPYPKPLGVRIEGSSRQLRTSMQAVAKQITVSPVQAGLIVFSQYAPRADWQPQLLTPGAALLALLDNTVAARRQPGLSLKALKHLVLSTPTIQSARSDAHVIASDLIRRVDAGLSQNPL